jgi:hypothetical protein
VLARDPDRKDSLLAYCSDLLKETRLASVSASHSGDWLITLPISSCGLRLNSEAVCVAVGLRLGIELCLLHSCPCGDLVDLRGVHALSCRLSGGWYPRHHVPNDLIWRPLSTAGVPTTKEPVGLLRSDGKHPDGLSFIPRKDGKPVTWNVTDVNSLADSIRLSKSHLNLMQLRRLPHLENARNPGNIPTSFIFEPIAFERLGPINTDAIVFLKDIGCPLIQASGDQRASELLFQRISLTVQRFNAILLKASFASLPGMD